jgi:halimadienyl-diphosphate synthase
MSILESVIVAAPLTIMDEMKDLLQAVGTGYVSNTAYDTAWVARLSEFDATLANRALRWLCEHQLPDGSWGAESPYYYHDRVISTLSAMIALTHRGRRASDRIQIERGLVALERISDGAAKALSSSEDAATVGFEMIIPTLVAEAERLGIIKQQGDSILGRLALLREHKLAKLAGLRISRHITAAHSAEMAGVDGLHLLDVNNLQEANGSVSNNPAATAYFSAYVRPGDLGALDYLRHVVDAREGAAPSFAPFDIFERAWVLWNFALAGCQSDPEMLASCQPHLEYLQKAWRPGRGLGFSAHSSLPDGDDTSVCFEVLAQFGRAPDIEAVLSYEEQDWFRCYGLEVNPSVGVNIHALGALRAAGFDGQHPSVRKVLDFIRGRRNSGGYWLDKWHISPYYSAAHAVILCRGYDDELCGQLVDWMLRNQQADGAWGASGLPTAEETAYCIQALAVWRRHGGKVPPGRIEQASFWLNDHSQPPYPPLWIDKSLYCPELVVKSVILSALALSEA